MWHWNRFCCLHSCLNLALCSVFSLPLHVCHPCPLMTCVSLEFSPFLTFLGEFQPLAFLGISVEGCGWLPAMLLSLSASLLATCLPYLIVGGPCDILSAFLLLSPSGYSVGQRSAPVGSCSDSVGCLPGWIQFSCPGWDRSPFLRALNILCGDWLRVLSVHLGIASFVLLYSYESAQYLEHQCFHLTPYGNLGKALAPFEQCLNKCSLLQGSHFWF